MKKVIIVCFVVSLGMVSCGPDSILVKSGAQHTCKIQELESKLKEEPENQELQQEYESSVKDLQLVIETAEESGREALKKAIQVAAKEECK